MTKDDSFMGVPIIAKKTSLKFQEFAFEIQI
jgi:hypothetical protein